MVVSCSRPVGDRAHSSPRFLRCMRRRLALSGSDAVTQINGSGFWLPGQMNTNEFSDPKESPQNLSSGGKVSLSLTSYKVPRVTQFCNLRSLVTPGTKSAWWLDVCAGRAGLCVLVPGEWALVRARRFTCVAWPAFRTEQKQIFNWKGPGVPAEMCKRQLFTRRRRMFLERCKNSKVSLIQTFAHKHRALCCLLWGLDCLWIRSLG